MKKLKGYEIRQMWLDFFKSKGHDVIPSASLIPYNDPTLLWINAGVAPLKKYFDGREVPQNKRMTNAQKSIRTNDIENVGKTARHHTFFEMLGNFSVGDYFRNEALKWAIELLTSKEWFDLDINKLYFTYYPDDLDTYNKWIEYGVDPSHLVPVKGNFWEIGEGPCGPDTEIFFDRGIKYDKDNIGPRLIKDDIENDRYIEIWNIVFSQYNAKAGVKREDYKELPSKNIDTGCGLERMACVMQEVETNYDTDLFMPIINKTEEITGKKYDGSMPFKVIADHVRSTVFALSDGASFSNEGRGYVLRRILRRAVRYGKKLGMNEAFLYRLVKPCVDNMKVFYPYLLEKEELVTKQIKLEEEKFLSTLESGEKRLLNYINSNSGVNVINKDIAFQLFDTFGFPLELSLEVANEYGLDVDVEGFNSELARQKKMSREARGKLNSMSTQNEAMMKNTFKADFIGYDNLSCDSYVKYIYSNGEEVNEANGKVLVIFDKTPFYAENGGQIGDRGTILLNGEEFDCLDTIKMPNGCSSSVIDMMDVTLKVGDEVKCMVDNDYRLSITKNHSSTHLLNEALREVVGSHVFQQGSNVANNVLRFDFNNFDPLTNEQILEIEKIVNEKIKAKLDVNIEEMDINKAKEKGAQAVFGEKYGKVVRVVNMGDYSIELCGGCHVKNTKDIERFAILGVESKGSGIFRVSACSSNYVDEEIDNVLVNVYKEIDLLETKIKDLSKELKLDFNLQKPDVLKNSYLYIIKTKEYLEELKEKAKELSKLVMKQQKESTVSLDDYVSQMVDIKDVKTLVCKVDASSGLDVNKLKDLSDRLADKVGKCVIVLALVNNDKIVFVVKSKVSEVNAGMIAKLAANITGGNGGGRPDFAQSGGRDVTKLDEAIKVVNQELEKLI